MTQMESPACPTGAGGLAMQCFHRVCDAVFDLAFPPCCTLCGDAFPESTSPALCDICIEAVLGTQRHWCSKCGRGVTEREYESEECRACIRSKAAPFEQVLILAAYENAMREAVIAGKKYVHEPLAMSIGTLLGQHVLGQIGAERLPDVITFVPSHWRRQMARGTTPAATLARQVAKSVGRPVLDVLKCSRNAPKQAMLAAKHREDNIQGNFRIRRASAIANKRILVVDDVMTTGATLAEVSHVLMRSGAQSVLVAAAARRAGKT